MKQPLTTSGSLVLALGVLIVAVGKFMSGDTPDWTEVTLAITSILGAIGLYKARDPVKADPTAAPKP